MPYKNPEVRKAYLREYSKRRYHEDLEYRKRHKERVASNNIKYRLLAKNLFDDWRSNGCSCCDEKELCCLVAHHVDSNGKDFNISNAVHAKMSVKTIKLELEKCVCVCANCHAKIHAGIMAEAII